VLTAAVATALVVSGTAAMATGATDVKTRDPLTIAREQLDAAREAAASAAAKLAEAETARAQVVNEIADIEREIPELRAHEADLRVIVKERAASLYARGSAPALDNLVGTTDALDAVRASHLTNLVNAHDTGLATELRVTATRLEARETTLRGKKAELDGTVEQVATTRDALDHKLAIASSAFDKVRTALTNPGTGVSSGAMRCPVDGFTVFTDDFGEERDGGTTHQGIDMAAVIGTPLVAVSDGDIVHDEDTAGGNGILLTDANGDVAYYAHLSRFEGDARHVAAGDVIGYVGVTGITTGPHLHFELRPRGGPAVDGYALLLGLCVDEMARPQPKP
jgi:murein DD-endopeptidase MepM/ murein hydrolase activator NlpD